MKLMVYLAAIIAMSPFVLMFAVLARALRTPPSTPALGTLCDVGYDDNDPGEDVDEPAIESKELHCPHCGSLHFDTGLWYHRPHRTHLCEECGHKWRPFEFYTRGV